jgi:Lrp/AsnC family transcriptional regulator for asnA, asnC and gidA
MNRETMRKGNVVKIDDTDSIILKMLLKDARTNYKDIAKACGISPPAVTKRVENLKSNGIIAGTRIGCSLKADCSTTAVIGVNVQEDKKSGIKKSIEDKIAQSDSFLTVYDEGIGYYQVVFGVVAKNIYTIDEIRYFIEGLSGVKGVDAHLWNGRTYVIRENLSLGK